MTTITRLGLGLLAAFGFVVSASVAFGQDGVRLRPIDPKPFYKPGDRIELEVRCTGAVTEDPIVLYNPSLDSDSGFILDDPLHCPSSRVHIEIPRNFIGKNSVSVLTRHGETRYGDLFHFEVRQDAPPSDLRLSADQRKEGCRLALFGEPFPQGIVLESVMADGTRFDLCKEGKVTVMTEPAGNALFMMKDGMCALTPKKAAPFKVVASYRTLRKEWPCTVDAPEESRSPRPPGPPAKKISPDDFLRDPSTLDRHPVEIGSCRTVEHWDTGNCYVFTQQRGKVSENADGRCDDLPGLRRRMEKAIRQGFCDSRSPDPAFAKPIDPYRRAGDLVTPRAYAIPSSGASDGPPRVSIPAFRNNPAKLDRHPMEVGKCRLVEHHTTGFCYVYSLLQMRKVSEHTDARCDELDEQRRRMRLAIDQGYCWPTDRRAEPAPPAAQPVSSTEVSPLQKTMTYIRRLAVLVEGYGVEHGSYPIVADVRALAALAPEEMPVTDGWGTSFAFVCDGKTYFIVSAGADRTFEPGSLRLDTKLAGETDSLDRDLVYSNGRFLQWPKNPGR